MPLLWRSLGCVSSTDPRKARRHKWPSESCWRHRRMALSLSGGARTGLGPHQSRQRPLAPVVAPGLCLYACWLDASSLWDNRLNFFEEVQRVHFGLSCYLICSSKDPRGQQNLTICQLFPVLLATVCVFVNALEMIGTDWLCKRVAQLVGSLVQRHCGLSFQSRLSNCKWGNLETWPGN